MIWHTPEDRQRGEEALGRHLLTEIKSLCPDLDLHPDFLAEVTATVARYCAEQGFDRQVPSGFLSVQLSRALRGIGEHDAAARVETRVVREAPYAAAFTDDRWPGAVSTDTWQLFAARLLRPTRLAVEDGSVTWVLDFSRTSVEAAPVLELALLPALRILIEKLSEVWEATSGEGVLGLKALHDPEMLDYCRSILARVASQKGWRSTPRALHMDSLQNAVRKRRGARRLAPRRTPREPLWNAGTEASPRTADPALPLED